MRQNNTRALKNITVMMFIFIIIFLCLWVIGAMSISSVVIVMFALSSFNTLIMFLYSNHVQQTDLLKDILYELKNIKCEKDLNLHQISLEQAKEILGKVTDEWRKK